MARQYKIDTTPSDEANAYWIGLTRAMDQTKQNPATAYQAIMSGAVCCIAAQLRAIEWRLGRLHSAIAGQAEHAQRRNGN